MTREGARLIEELWELRDPNTDQLKGDRYLPVGAWELPAEVTLQRDAIAGAPEPIVSPGRWAKEERGLLEAFVRLQDAPPSRVAGFAKRWGMLGLCHHEAPCCTPLWVERIDTWRMYAAAVAAALSIANRLRAQQPGRAEEWKALLLLHFTWHWAEMDSRNERRLNVAEAPDERTLALSRRRRARRLRELHPGTPAHLASRRLDWQREDLARFVNGWVGRGGISLGLAWSSNMVAPRTQLHTCGLFGALGIQMMAAVASAPTVQICNGCGELVEGRRRSSSAGVWCSKQECRRKMWLAAQQKRRASQVKNATNGEAGL